jgi:hypothetical protein
VIIDRRGETSQQNFCFGQFVALTKEQTIPSKIHWRCICFKSNNVAKLVYLQLLLFIAENLTKIYIRVTASQDFCEKIFHLHHNSPGFLAMGFSPFLILSFLK